MGTPTFASNILEGLLKEGFNIVAVVSQPDKEVGRKRILTPTPVKEVALKYNLPVLQPRKVRVEYADILAYDPELIITCAYGQIIPEEMLNYPKFKCINTHGSLLPKYRGGAPIQRSIINGDEKTGMTIMYMSKGMDEGDILYKKEMPILDEDTNATMFSKLSDLALEMLLEFLPKLFAGDVNPVAQDSGEVTYAYNLSKDDEYINFNDDVRTVFNHIRGLLDNPGAYSVLEDKKYKFHKVTYTNDFGGKPCEVLGLKDNKFAIGCVNGAILVESIQPEGKGIMDAKSFFNGAGRNLVGKKFNETR